MKSFIIFFLIICTALVHGQEKWKGGYETNKEIYSATVNNTKIAVFLSEGSFDPEKHKIIPFRVEKHDGEEVAIWPKVSGYTVVGIDGPVPSKKMALPHLQRLAVKFGDKIVECPPELLAHIFLPWTETTFKAKERSTLVTISSDAKTVIIDLACGDGAGVGSQVFTISENGKCIVGQPEAPTP